MKCNILIFNKLSKICLKYESRAFLENDTSDKKQIFQLWFKDQESYQYISADPKVGAGFYILLTFLAISNLHMIITRWNLSVFL